MQKIMFIVNPKAGTSKKQHLEKEIQNTLNLHKYNYSIRYTNAPGHATQLAKEAVDNHINIVVAVGGDGSINEIIPPLVHSDTTLGVLPMGSGNGFSMHIGIGRVLKKALHVLNTGKIATIDSCLMNDRPFINLAGLGIDGLVSYEKAKLGLSGFSAYATLGTKHFFQHPYTDFEISTDHQPFNIRTGYLLEIANGPMFGYGFSIVPHAVLNDGFMDILLIKKRPKLQYIGLVPRLYFQNIEKSNMIETFKARDFKIKLKKPMKMHLDGEGFEQTGTLHFKILPQSIKVIVPQDSKY